MLFETVHLNYNHNLKNKAQGTRSMMQPNFVDEYAKSLGMTSEQVFADDVASFGSTAWYLVNKCDFKVRQGMWGGQESGYKAYVTDCLQAGSADLDTRMALWKKGLDVIGKD